MFVFLNHVNVTQTILKNNRKIVNIFYTQYFLTIIIVLILKTVIIIIINGSSRSLLIFRPDQRTFFDERL